MKYKKQSGWILRKCIRKFIEEGKLEKRTGVSAGLYFISKLKHDTICVLNLGVVSTYSLKPLQASLMNYNNNDSNSEIYCLLDSFMKPRLVSNVPLRKDGFKVLIILSTCPLL